jgi:hypothetical protein
VSPDSTVLPQTPRASVPGSRLAIALALGLALLAVLETAQALIAPRRAPRPEDWSALATEVRAAFRPGDLIVAAPAWADPVLRQYLGDVITIPMATRMDDARYGRVWEVSEHGAHAPDARGTTTRSQRFGTLDLRLVERKPAAITYDFLEHWTDARVSRWEPTAGHIEGCPWKVDRFVCPSGGTVHRELVEVDTRIRTALLAPPVPHAVLVVEWPAVPLGRELVFRAGLHDVWARKLGRGTVQVDVWMDGQWVTGALVGNRSGWKPIRIDTSARDGGTSAVRVQISAPETHLRHLAFAAEARR